MQQRAAQTTTTASCPVATDRPAAGGCPVDHGSAFDPFGSAYLADPPGSLAWSRTDEPVFFNETTGYWVVTRYEDVKAVFRDNETFSPAIALEKMTPSSPEAMAVLESYDYAINRTLVNEDEPAHMPRRRALAGPFQPSEVLLREEYVRDLARGFVDRFVDRGRVDLVDGMLYELPLTVALHFLGIPEEDMDTLRRYSVSHTLNTWGRPTAEQQVDVAESVGKFWQYAGGVLEKLRRDPSGPGWMPYSLRVQQEAPDVVTDSYLHSMMMAGLVAAHETTAHAASNAVRLLLENRHAWEAICADPSLIPGAVDECLRHTGSVAAWRRVATRDAEIAGVAVPAGAKLLIVNSSANHDDRRFEDPDSVDILRDDADDHLTFGYGAHRCLGKHLARMELQVILQELTTRLPHLRLAEQDFSFLPNTSFRGPEHLWVEWDVAQNPESASPDVLDRRSPLVVGTRIRPRRTVLVDRAELVADGVLEVRFTSTDGHPLPSWTAGAHIDVDCGEFSRQYSLCGPHDGTYRIAVQLDALGRGGSRYIHEQLRAGQRTHINGPRNHFRLEPGASRTVLVAGGIGITPIIAMADALKAEGAEYEVHYASRTRASTVYLDRLLETHEGRVTVYPSDEGRRLDVSALLATPVPGERVYACGPDRLIDALEAATADRPADSLHVEHFTSLGNQLDPDGEHEFDVELMESARTIRVRRDQTMLQALHIAGIDVDSECEEGICGTCEVAVVHGEVDHRDRVLSSTERAACNRMMSCCSRAAGSTLTLAL